MDCVMPKTPKIGTSQNVDLYKLDVRSLAVASRPRQSETEWRLANYGRIGAYRTRTSGKDFPRKMCAQNSGDASRIIKVITIEQAYAVTTIQA